MYVKHELDKIKVNFSDKPFTNQNSSFQFMVSIFTKKWENSADISDKQNKYCHIHRRIVYLFSCE